MKFKKLKPKDIQFFIETYNNNKSKEADKILSEKFEVEERTIRNWANRFGLTKGSQTITVTNTEVPEFNHHHAKVLVFDIETAPIDAYVWGAWEQSIGRNMDMMKADWFMLTWSAKWLFDEKIMSDKLAPEEALTQDDERITKTLWHLINEADIIIAHNARKFDEKKMNTRFIKYGLPKPMPYQVIDTLQHARKKLAVTSNKLDYLGQFFGVGGKMETGGWKLWADSIKGDAEALKKMEEYNVRDITLLEDVYLKMRPFIQPHPNMGLFIAEDVMSCPTCGDTENLERGGTYATSANIYEAIRCTSCGSVGRSRKGKLSAKDKSNLTAPAAR